ncbi:hypothetical protein Droror1_Dr00014137 [Drosera rotundifolia]
MAITTRILSLSRSLLTPPLLSRSFTTNTTRSLSLLRSLVAAPRFGGLGGGGGLAVSRGFSTRRTQSSLQDSNPNWTNRPPKETILLDGCDFNHWLVVMEKPDEGLTRDEICDLYVKTLAKVVGSEEEARHKIYSVSTRCYFAFGALVDEELSYKLKELEGVRWVLPDSYLDVRNKDYGGEPFIDGRPVPYDPKYHEEWERNNAKAMERNRRNDRPRSGDRARNFERRRQNMQNPDFQRGPLPFQPPQQNVAPNNAVPPPPQYNAPNNAPPQYNAPSNAPPQYNAPSNGPPQYNAPSNAPPQYNAPSNAPPQYNAPSNAQPQYNVTNAPNMGGISQNNMNGAPNFAGHPPNHMQGTPQNNMGNAPNMGGPPNPGAPPYRGPMPPPNMGGGPNTGWHGNMPNANASNVPNFQNNRGMQHQNGQMAHQGQAPNYQNNYAPNDMRGPPVGNTYNTRDLPPLPPNSHQ